MKFSILLISVAAPATTVVSLAVPEPSQPSNTSLVKRGNACDRSRNDCSAPLMFFSQIQRLGQFSYVKSEVRLPKSQTGCSNSFSIPQVGSIVMNKGIGEDDEWGCKIYLEKDCKGKELWVEKTMENPAGQFRYGIKSYRCWHKGTYDDGEPH